MAIWEPLLSFTPSWLDWSLCYTRSLKVRLTTSLFKSQFNHFFGTMTCVTDWLLWIIITWLQKTQPLYNNIECHRDVQKLLKTNFVDLFSLCLHLSLPTLILPTLILPLVFLKCYIHNARKMTIHSSNSTRKPWEEEYPIETQRYLVWYELVLWRYSCQTSTVFWYKNVHRSYLWASHFEYFSGRVRACPQTP